VALTVGGPVAWVQTAGRSGIVPAPALADGAPVGIVFGAGLRPNGEPSTYLTRRLEAAQLLYEQGTVSVILVSGDNGSTDHDEPTAMRQWLVAHGVPPEHVVRDFAGFDTHDTCVRAATVFGIDRAVLITQDYHLPRAMFSCRAAGLSVQGVGVSSDSVDPARALNWRLRELPASWKACWDAVTQRSPRYPGPPETSVGDALHQMRSI